MTENEVIQPIEVVRKRASKHLRSLSNFSTYSSNATSLFEALGCLTVYEMTSWMN